MRTIIKHAPSFLLMTTLLIFAAIAPGCGDDVPMGVTLNDAGEGEKQALRLHPTPGSVQRSTMTMSLSIDQEHSDGNSLSVPVPKMEFLTETVVDAVHPDGRIDSSFTIIEMKALSTPGVDSFVRDEVQRAFDQIAGTKGTASYSATGKMLKYKVDVPPNVDPTMKSAFDGLEQQMSIASVNFPEEPVGVGAVWTVKNDATVSGVEQTVTSTYTVKSIDGDLVELEVKIESTADEQNIDSPDAPANMTVTLNNSEGHGSGLTVIDLRWLDPIKASVSMTADQELSIRMGSERLDIDQTAGSEVTMKTTKTTFQE